MIFPFTFNFSVPGILNPFSRVPSPLSPPVSASMQGSAGEQGNSKHSRIQHSPIYDSCQSSIPNSHSQGPLGYSSYRDNIPAPAYPTSSTSVPFTAHNRRISRAELPKIERRPSPSPSTSVSASSSLRALPLSRKRGWEPAFGSDSIQSLSPPIGKGKTDSTTSLTLLSSSGYLDTPAKYRDMAGDISMRDNVYTSGESQEAEDDAPPLKKRKGLAGSIVSTAVSAALIGTAVGLTVYRLWRERGKEPQAKLTHPASSSSHHMDGTSTPGSDSDQQVPPPPYDPGAWKPPIQEPQQPMLALTPPTPASTPRKNRRTKRPVGGGHHHHSSSASARRAGRPRHAVAGPSGSGSAVGASQRVRPEFDFGREGRGVGLGLGVDMDGEGHGEVEDKMDWIGDKLSMLIEQGRRALQSEVVVMSEAKEDEVDDGRGDWEEEDNDDETGSLKSRKSRSRAGSFRKSRPRNIVPPSPHQFASSHSGSISASPRMSSFPSGLTSSSSAYATPSTSYSTALASGGFAPSSSLSALSSYSAKVASGHGHVRGLSYESALPSSSSAVGREEQETWESPELKESMERARARALARRAGLSGGGGPV